MSIVSVRGLTMARILRLHTAGDVLKQRPAVEFEAFESELNHPRAAELVASWKAYVEAKEAHEALISAICQEMLP